MDCRQLNRWLNGEDFPMPPIQAEAGTEDAKPTAREVIADHFYKAHEWNGTYAMEQAARTIAALHAAGYKIICHDRTKANPTMG